MEPAAGIVCFLSVEQTDFQKLVSACEKLLADQAQLMARIEAEGGDVTDALHLRTQILNLLCKVRSASRHQIH